MRTLLACRILVIALFAYAAPAPAHETEDAKPTYESNYRLSLSYFHSENQRTDIEFIVAGQKFRVSTFEPRIEFQGSIRSSDGKFVVLEYNLSIEKSLVTGQFAQSSGESEGNESVSPFQTIQRVQSGITSNAKIELGSPIDIFKVGSESVQLVVTKVN